MLKTEFNDLMISENSISFWRYCSPENQKKEHEHEQHKQLIDAIRRKNLGNAENLLTAGVDPNASPFPHGPALYYAICLENGQALDAIRLLCKYKANPNVFFFHNCPHTSLSYLTRNLIDVDAQFILNDSEKIYHLQAIKLLLYHGANPYKKKIPHQQESAFEIASRKNDQQLIMLFSNAQKNLIKTLHALLSRGEAPFPSEIAFKIAEFRYEYEKEFGK